MLRRGLLGFATLAVLLFTATGAMAAGLTVDSVLAIEYESGVFSAAVLAHGPAVIADAQILVNDVAVSPDRVNHVVLLPAKHLTLFTATKFGPEMVVKPSDVVTAVVTDMEGTTAEKSVTCAAGRFLRQLVVCR